MHERMNSLKLAQEGGCTCRSIVYNVLRDIAGVGRESQM
jgi:hypothetical protein